MSNPYYIIALDAEEDCVTLIRKYSDDTERLIVVLYAEDENGEIDLDNHRILCALEGLSYPHISSTQRAAINELLQFDQMDFDSEFIYVPSEPRDGEGNLLFADEAFILEGEEIYPLYVHTS